MGGYCTIIWEYVYISNMSLTECVQYFDMMSPDRQNRVKKIRNQYDQKRTIVGELLAKKLLSNYNHISQEQIVIRIGNCGKPYAAGCSEFNISHAGDMLVCCVSDKHIGVDVESIKPIKPNIVKKVVYSCGYSIHLRKCSV